MAWVLSVASEAGKLEFTFSSVPPALFKEARLPTPPVLGADPKHRGHGRGLRWEERRVTDSTGHSTVYKQRGAVACGSAGFTSEG